MCATMCVCTGTRVKNMCNYAQSRTNMCKFLPFRVHTCRCVCVYTCTRVCVKVQIDVNPVGATAWQYKAYLRCPTGHVELGLTAWWKWLCQLPVLSRTCSFWVETDAVQSQDVDLSLHCASTQMTCLSQTALGLLLWNWPWPLTAL